MDPDRKGKQFSEVPFTSHFGANKAYLNVPTIDQCSSGYRLPILVCTVLLKLDRHTDF